jgi:hypothetical protein
MSESGARNRVQRIDVTSRTGRRVEMWVSGDDAPRPKFPPVIIGPGASRRIHSVSPFASYLNANGIVTYRYDHLDHAGLSEGENTHMTISALYETLEAVTGTVAEIHNCIPMLVTASLTSRCAFRLAARPSSVARVISLVGVVDVAATLTAALGQDYWDDEDMPEFIEFDGSPIVADRFRDDAVRNGWKDFEGTVADLADARVPIIDLHGDRDAWASADAVERAFAQGAGGPRRVYRLGYCEHDLARNPVAVREVLRLVTRLILDGGEADPDSMNEPTFKDLARHAIDERRLERILRTSALSESKSTAGE